MLSTLLNGGFTKETLLAIILSIPSIMIALSFHEAAHGYVAYKMGDPTAKNLGRITVNPIKHLDPIGSLFMLLFGFGWAKPVPIVTRHFKNQKKGMALSALAGPVTNFLLGVIGVLITNLVCLGFILSGSIVFFGGELYLKNEDVFPIFHAITLFLTYFSFYNFTLSIFNMIPIPPFDGSRVLFAFLPDKYYFGIMRYENVLLIAVLVLLNVSDFSVSNLVWWIYDIFDALFKCIYAFV